MSLATSSLGQLTRGHVRTLAEHRYLYGVDVELIRVVLYAALFGKMSMAVASVATAVAVRRKDFFWPFLASLALGQHAVVFASLCSTLLTPRRSCKNPPRTIKDSTHNEQQTAVQKRSSTASRTGHMSILSHQQQKKTRQGIIYSTSSVKRRAAALRAAASRSSSLVRLLR